MQHRITLLNALPSAPRVPRLSIYLVDLTFGPSLPDWLTNSKWGSTPRFGSALFPMLFSRSSNGCMKPQALCITHLVDTLRPFLTYPCVFYGPGGKHCRPYYKSPPPLSSPFQSGCHLGGNCRNGIFLGCNSLWLQASCSLSISPSSLNVVMTFHICRSLDAHHLL